MTVSQVSEQFEALVCKDLRRFLPGIGGQGLVKWPSSEICQLLQLCSLSAEFEPMYMEFQE